MQETTTQTTAHTITEPLIIVAFGILLDYAIPFRITSIPENKKSLIVQIQTNPKLYQHHEAIKHLLLLLDG